jgi:hypothetical protein
VKLADLDAEERLALVALVRFMVRMDGVFSPAEVTALTALAKEVGSAEFWATMSEVQQRVATADDMVQLTEQVRRREVQAWIYGVLLGLAAVDGVDGSEIQLLEWVQETWGLRAG